MQIARATRRKQNLLMVMSGGQQRQQFIERMTAPQHADRYFQKKLGTGSARSTVHFWAEKKD